MVFEDKSLAPYRGKEPFIFISYSHRNADQAAEIISNLNRAGFRVWYDEGLIPGREWDENIARIIMGCSFFVALLTKEYLASSNCKDELNYARDKDKPMVLVYLEEVSLPAGMELRLGRLFAVHRKQYARDEAFYAKICAADGIARCNTRYTGNAVPQNPPPARTAQPAPKHVVAESEEYEDELSSSGSGLRVSGIILVLVLLLGAAFLLYRLSGRGQNPSNYTSSYNPPAASYSEPASDPTEESSEANLDIEYTPEPDPEPSVVLDDWEEDGYDVSGPADEIPADMEEEIFVTPDTPEEISVLPEPDPTPEPTPSPTPTPESTAVSEPENIVITDPVSDP